MLFGMGGVRVRMFVWVWVSLASINWSKILFANMENTPKIYYFVVFVARRFSTFVCCDFCFLVLLVNNCHKSLYDCNSEEQKKIQLRILVIVVAYIF